jgi:hypothetical protein
MADTRSVLVGRPDFVVLVRSLQGVDAAPGWVTNDLSRLAAEAPGLVAKPISGGGHCMPMTALLIGIDPDGAAPHTASGGTLADAMVRLLASSA